MQQNSLVSVIVPVFNVAPYLAEALDSVINQTYRNLEIIVVDDGSTDDSGKICDEYAAKDKRIKSIHQTNQGVSAARNLGLDLMKGELVAFLDPDDAYKPEFIDTMVNTMYREKADIVLCGMTIHKTTKKMSTAGKKHILKLGGGYDSKTSLRALANGKLNASVCDKLYKRALFQDIRFPVGQFYEDHEVVYRTLEICEKLYVLDQPLYLCRVRPGSITQTFPSKHLVDYMLYLDYVTSFIKARTPAIFTPEDLRLNQQACLRTMISLFISGSEKSGNERDKIRDYLRNKIIELESEVEIKNCPLVTRVAYWILNHCPWLLKPLYRFVWPLIRTLRDFTGKLRG